MPTGARRPSVAAPARAGSTVPRRCHRRNTPGPSPGTCLRMGAPQSISHRMTGPVTRPGPRCGPPPPAPPPGAARGRTCRTRNSRARPPAPAAAGDPVAGPFPARQTRLESTSLSRFSPSGVSSNTHASTSAGTNPIARTMMTTRSSHDGRSKAGRTVLVTCTTSHAATRYNPAMRCTLRRLISSRKGQRWAIPCAASGAQSSKSGEDCRTCGSGLARNVGRRVRSGAGWCHGRFVERLRGSTPVNCQNDIGALAAPARPVLSKLSAGLIMRDGVVRWPISSFLTPAATGSASRPSWPRSRRKAGRSGGTRRSRRARNSTGQIAEELKTALGRTGGVDDRGRSSRAGYAVRRASAQSAACWCRCGSATPNCRSTSRPAHD